jgi:hypothetical protein
MLPSNGLDHAASSASDCVSIQGRCNLEKQQIYWCRGDIEPWASEDVSHELTLLGRCRPYNAEGSAELAYFEPRASRALLENLQKKTHMTLSHEFNTYERDATRGLWSANSYFGSHNISILYLSGSWLGSLGEIMWVKTQ